MTIKKVIVLTCTLLAATTAHAEPQAGEVWKEPKTGMEFVWAPAGCFQMGGKQESVAEPVHQVCVKGFWIGRYEVTQAQFQQVMESNPSKFRGANNPVDQVKWQDAKLFAEEMGYVTGTKVRLPSEAEWEYACRAGGAHDSFCGGGGRLERMAWYRGNSGETPHPVGQRAANDWGLYDMSGNVQEWVADDYHKSYKSAPTDGSAWLGGGENGSWKYVLRGCGFDSSAEWCGAGHRNGAGEKAANGIRLVRVLP